MTATTHIAGGTRAETGRRMTDDEPITVVPATFDRWADFEKLMGERGGYGGCWCMLWRLFRPYSRIKDLKQFFVQNKLDILIQVDGGVSLSNAEKLTSFGVDVMVVGSVIFNAENPKQAISKLKSLTL